MISVFTPLSQSGNAHIEATFASLLAQSHQDWEWVVVENHGGRLPAAIGAHPKVRVFEDDEELEGLGALKGACCELCDGDILFELDHDDLLHPDALAKTFARLQHAEVTYSDFAEFRDGDWTPDGYDAACGWKQYPVTFQGHALIAMRAPPITAQNLRRIDYCPHHLRAFRTAAYFKIGGYDRSLVHAEDQDLLKRFYLHGLHIAHIPECLYFYRIHQRQTMATQASLVDDWNWRVYERAIRTLGAKFAEDAGLAQVDLRHLHLGGAACCADERHSPRPDLSQPWPMATSSVGLLLAEDVLQQLPDPIHVMNEAYRVLAPGGFFLIRVPSSDGRGAFQNPRNRSFWNEHSFWYYTRSEYAAELPEFVGRFQVSRLRTYLDAAREIPQTEAHLFALKPGYEPMGLVTI